MAEEMASLRPFLSAAGRRRLGLDERRSLTTTGHREAVSLPRNTLYVNPAGVLRDDAGSPEGAAPGANPAHTARQLLDGCGIDRAVLIGGEVLGLARCRTPTPRPWSRAPTTTGSPRRGSRPTRATAAPSPSAPVTRSRPPQRSGAAPPTSGSSPCCS